MQPDYLRSLRKSAAVASMSVTFFADMRDEASTQLRHWLHWLRNPQFTPYHSP
jgi:hypothetical protein